MTGRCVIKGYDCALGNLLNERYTYYQDDETVLESLKSIFGSNPNKRKPRNGRYEWEYDDAA